ncbi:unnamed protein product [Ilex paraguariensis]|uniref:BED-type domain-containing protein n=1 Tax=Ilex paraguariensis TaxID=185542 RepID=A0ABC8QP15_9AQUA
MLHVKEEDVVVISDHSETSNGEQQKREVRLKSKVWQHFTKLEKKTGIREECLCNHCKKTFACSNKSGTSHLLRHITRGSCPVYKKERVDKSLTVSSFAEDTSELGIHVVPWTLDQGLGQTPTQQSNDVQDEQSPEGLEDLNCQTCNTSVDDYAAQPLSIGRQLHQEPTSKSQHRDESWMYELRACAGKLVGLINEGIPTENATKTPETGIAPDYSIAAAVKCLNEMEDIPQSSAMYLDAFEILKDANEREAFICLNPEPRRRWLQRMLNRRSPSCYSYDI